VLEVLEVACAKLACAGGAYVCLSLLVCSTGKRFQGSLSIVEHQKYYISMSIDIK
jgi:hypothetical protein